MKETKDRIMAGLITVLFVIALFQQATIDRLEKQDRDLLKLIGQQTILIAQHTEAIMKIADCPMPTWWEAFTDSLYLEPLPIETLEPSDSAEGR